MLAVGRALMAKTKMLLLDELSMDWRRSWSNHFFASILEIKAGGVTTILIEQGCYACLTACRQSLCPRNRCRLLWKVKHHSCSMMIVCGLFILADERPKSDPANRVIKVNLPVKSAVMACHRLYKGIDGLFVFLPGGTRYRRSCCEWRIGENQTRLYPDEAGSRLTAASRCPSSR